MAKIRCPRCKEYYENYGMLTTACPSCTEKMDAEYIMVRTYVKEHFGATITEVSQETGVPYNKIVDYVKMEMLEIREDSTTFLSCSACGAKIYTGILCDDCKKRTGNTQQVILGKTKDFASKMHITVGGNEEALPDVKKKKKL